MLSKFIILIPLLLGCDNIDYNPIPHYGYGDKVCVYVGTEFHNCKQPLIINDVYAHGNKQPHYVSKTTTCGEVIIQIEFEEDKIIPCKK